MLTEVKPTPVILGKPSSVLWPQFPSENKEVELGIPQGAFKFSDNRGGPGCSHNGPTSSCGGHPVNLLNPQRWVQGAVTRQQITPSCYKRTRFTHKASTHTLSPGHPSSPRSSSSHLSDPRRGLSSPLSLLSGGRPNTRPGHRRCRLDSWAEHSAQLPDSSLCHRSPRTPRSHFRRAARTFM